MRPRLLDARTHCRLAICAELGLDLVADASAMGAALAQLAAVDVAAMPPLERARHELTLARIRRLQALERAYAERPCTRSRLCAVNRARTAVQLELVAIAELAAVTSAIVESA